MPGGRYPPQQRPRRPLEPPGRRRDLRKTKDDAQDDCHARRHTHSVLPTVLDHCTPSIRGEDDDFHNPMCMYTIPPCVYKRRRWASFKGVAVGPFGRTKRLALLTEHIRSSEPRYWRSPHSTPPLAEDLGASLPLSPRLYPLLQAPPVQDSTMLSHTPLLDVRPHDRNQDKPMRYCVASCINI